MVVSVLGAMGQESGIGSSDTNLIRSIGTISWQRKMGKEDGEKLTRGILIGDDDDNACSKKTIMSCDKNDDACRGTGAWSDLTHHVLFLVMMQLGAIDFVAFSGVCKSWRSFAFSHMNTFMASRPPMFWYHDYVRNEVDWCCDLKDVEGRRYKTLLPHSAHNMCIGVTCGYVILLGTTYGNIDFLLINLITRHELYFPDPPSEVTSGARQTKVILVFSPSISGGWVLVVLRRNTRYIWFSRVGASGGKGEWDYVSSTLYMQDIQFLKGKIYALHSSEVGYKTRITGVMRLDLKESKLTVLETRKFPRATHIVCLGDDNLYLVQDNWRIYKLDFDEMEWVMADENTHAFFISYGSQSVAVKRESWWHAQFRISTSDDLCGNEIIFISDYWWYYPHDCLTVNRLDDRV